ncbi:MAG: hypothetical protein HY553_16260 [Elusimicrobia bacterium]|nr:hypothetical protein [Elusimicrobiota bacterium]
MGAWLALLLIAAQTHAKTLHLDAFDAEGNPLIGPALLAHIAPRSRRPPVNGGFYVTDLDDTPATGRPWVVAAGSSTVIAWSGPSHVRVSFPWPVTDDGFSTVTIDNEGEGYSDGDRILLNEAITLSQYKLFKDSLEVRSGKWEPTYKPSRKAKEQQEALLEALAAAKRETEPGKRAAAYEKALTRVSAAWATMLFEHGVQTAAHPKLGPGLRWGLTLDETIVNRVADFDDIAKKLGSSGANWVRLVFRKNPDDFTYSNPRSFLEYDGIVAALGKRKVRVMASVLDSTMWPRDVDPKAVEARVRNLVMKYKDTIRSWEVASEPNGDWIGGGRGALSDETIFKTISTAANAVKEIDRSLETVATLYWWEGTAGDDRHPTFAWLRRAIFDGALKPFDVVGLSIFPDDHPMGMAFDRVFGRLRQLLPDKRLMIGGFGYVEGKELDGYWWLDAKDVDGARKDLVILYSGAGASIPAGLGGGFWWPTLQTMLDGSRSGDSLFRIYRRTMERLGR